MPEITKPFKEIETVVILGNGSVATHLIEHFTALSIPVVQQFGRTQKTDSKSKIPFTNTYQHIRTDADLYIVAVSDDAIAEVVKQIPELKGIIVHTAGSVSMEILAPKQLHYGVLYPLQSFSNNRNIYLQNSPFLLEANNSDTEIALMHFARRISNNVTVMSYDERLTIHIAAVFACNFTNHMATIAKQLLDEKNIDIELLKPLVRETFDKILTSNPKESQTGPAKRNDIKILEKHSEMLTSNPIFQEIYTTISSSITTMYNKE